MSAVMARFEPLTLAELPGAIWRTRLPVRFGSCDPAGIVYTPEYLNLFNGVIEDWYGDALGLPYHELVRTRRARLGEAHGPRVQGWHRVRTRHLRDRDDVASGSQIDCAARRHAPRIEGLSGHWLRAGWSCSSKGLRCRSSGPSDCLPLSRFRTSSFQFGRPFCDLTRRSGGDAQLLPAGPRSRCDRPRDVAASTSGRVHQTTHRASPER